MKNQEKIHAFFNPSKNVKVPDNVFTPKKQLNTLKIARTIQPKERATFNEVYQNAFNQLKK